MKNKLPFFFLITIFFMPLVYAKGIEMDYYIRRGIADKNKYLKPASFNLSIPDSAGCFYSIDAGITSTGTLPKSSFLLQEISFTAEMHKNNNIDKEQELYSFTISTWGVQNFNKGLLRGLALNNSVKFSYKRDGIKKNNSIKLEYSLLPVWHRVGILKMFFINYSDSSALLGLYFEHETGINYEELVKAESSFDGSIFRYYIKLNLGLYPLYDFFGDGRVVIVVSRSWWQTINDDNFLTPTESKNPNLWDLSLAVFFYKSKSSGFNFGLQVNYINGSNPDQNLLDQSFWKVSFMFSK